MDTPKSKCGCGPVHRWDCVAMADAYHHRTAFYCKTEGEPLCAGVVDLERENAELVEALEGLIWLAEPHFSDETQLEQLKFCRAALAKVKERT